MSSPDGENEPQSPLESPSTPISPDAFPEPNQEPTQRPKPQFSQSAMSSITPSNTSSGMLRDARQPQASRSINPALMQKMRDMHINRQSSAGLKSPGPAVHTPGGLGGVPANFELPQRPGARPANSSPSIPNATSPKPSLAVKRGIQLPGRLPGGLPGAAPAAAPGKREKPKMTLSAMQGTPSGPPPEQKNGGFDKYRDRIDVDKGLVKFPTAVVHGEGVDFASGKSFRISLDEVEPFGELGKGNYGTVFVVRHSKPKFRKQGGGLSSNMSRDPQKAGEDIPAINPAGTGQPVATPTNSTAAQVHGAGGPTGRVMAMKEMRLELDDAKFQTIIMELDVLHRCVSPYIVDFYGAFFQEGAVYICMEFMDGGSVDKLYGDGIPENVLRKITYATTLGLKSLKEEHNIIHRDVKPTNILINTRGVIKICDFGVSGNLVASIAKTSIGCQSYMAPERISSGGMSQAGAAGAGTYSVQSDIWSLGLTIIECALGRYPYPPETYDNIFSQLAAIVDGAPPDLPSETFSEAARDFTAGCLNKIANLRPTYPMLLQHAWLAPLSKPSPIAEVDEDAALSSPPASSDADPANPAAAPQSYDREVAEWVIAALERRASGKMNKSTKPALHTAPLDVAAASPAAGTSGEVQA